MTTQISQVVAAPRRLDDGIDPDLVFKVSAVSRPSEGAFENRGLDVLGETRDYTYFVLSEDQGSAMAEAIAQYTETGTLRSLIDLIQGIEPYGPSDRRGPGLPIEPTDGLMVDIVIWASPDMEEASRRADIVTRVLERSGALPALRSITPRRNLIRVRVSPEGLQDLLDTSVIEQVRTPPVPFMDFRDWRDLGADDLDRVDRDGAEVGVLDDAPATAHPLLAGLVVSIDEIAPAGYAWQQPGHHGTEVVGRLLLPYLSQELRDSEDITAVGTTRVARVLEPDPHRAGSPPRFPTSGFPHDLVDQAIRLLHDQYEVRIFNLSFGYDEPYDDTHVGALTEVIDELVRELDIVVVVPTGNTAIHPYTAMTPSNHHVADDYFGYLHTPEQRIAEPGAAALAVSVGSLALSGAPAELGRLGNFAIANPDQVSPFSRCGPGIGGASRQNKPELVEYGGNVVLNDSGHVVPNDLGASVVSTALDSTTGRLFAACNGTSFAAPAVSRVAADVFHAYPDASANLVRALLGASAVRPATADEMTDELQRAAAFGLGRPDSTRAVTSGGTRATMTYDGSMTVDSVNIHPIPLPDEFRRGNGGYRTLTVALAFDPPVRRQRREYLASSMKFDVYRNINPDDLREILMRQPVDERAELIRDSRRLSLAPGSNALLSSTLQVRRWSRRQTFVDDDDVFYLAVTHSAATWARDDDSYQAQRYALAVTLEDQFLVEADLRQLLLDRVRVPARVRVSA